MAFVDDLNGICIGTRDGQIGYIQLLLIQSDVGFLLDERRSLYLLNDIFNLTNLTSIFKTQSSLLDSSLFLCGDMNGRIIVFKMYY